MTVYGQGVRSAAADMFERGLGRDAVACALGIPSCAVRNVSVKAKLNTVA